MHESPGQAYFPVENNKAYKQADGFLDAPLLLPHSALVSGV